MNKPTGMLIKLERLLNAKKLIPVLGPSCITFGEDDELLYPWLAKRLVENLEIEIPEESSGKETLDLQNVVSAYLKAHRPIEELSIQLDILLDSPSLQPGPFLRKIASIDSFKVFFTLGFDPLLERALSKVRFGDSKTPRIWEFSLADTSTDLPFNLADTKETIIAYLFGKISPIPSFNLWDRDAIEFVWRLQQSLPALPNLRASLENNNLLFFGSNFSDWFVRFFLRVIHGKQLNQNDTIRFHFAESQLDSNPDTILFYDALHGVVEFIHGEPLAFAENFVDYILPKYALPETVPNKAMQMHACDKTQQGTIFVSYAHEDKELIQPLIKALNKKGCRIWVDKERLSAGENFDERLENAIKKQCGLFLSVISTTTESRKESYFHKERCWAAERFKSFAPGTVFYVPVVIDDVEIPPKKEPKVFENCHLFSFSSDLEGLVEYLYKLQLDDGVIQ